MKKTLTFLFNIIIGLLVWVIYLWYRASMFIVITEPILKLDDWLKPHKGQNTEYWTMIILLVSAISLCFVSIWWIALVYIILIVVNLGAFALWKRFKK